MAYDPENPPALMVQGIGGTTGMRFFALMWIDPILDVLEPGYISNAIDIGMRAGDTFIYKDTNRGEWAQYSLIVSELDADGAATMMFPEIPEEAIPELDTFDPDDPTQYLALYQGGRLSRLQMGLFAPDGSEIASQAEAEAGVENEKRMTALRTKQAMDAQRPFASQAEAEAGVSTTTVMSPLRVAQAIAALGGDLPTITAFAETLLDDADAAAMLATLGISAFIITLLNDADATTARATLGVQEIATAAEYRANTADRLLGTDEVWSAATLVTLTDAATITVDMSTFINGQVTLGGNRTLGAPSNAKPGQSGMIVINQDGTGSRTLAFNAAYHFPFGTDPVLSTTSGARDVLFYTVLTSSVLLCSFAKSMG